jgi:predicted NAD-dependent protein-ADP-ribosyltransferase YbiA (DUF1768 family)
MGGCCFLIAPNGTKTKGPPVTNNFHIRPFFFQGTRFFSVEQAFQALKSPPGSATFARVAALAPHAGESDSEHGHRAWGAGQGGALQPGWDTAKIGLMLALVRARTAAHADLREELLATGYCVIEGKPSTGWVLGGHEYNWRACVWGGGAAASEGLPCRPPPPLTPLTLELPPPHTSPGTHPHAPRNATLASQSTSMALS